MQSSVPSPRHPCPVCSRDVSTRHNQFARHDPPKSGRIPGYLVSCSGSLRPHAAGAEQPVIFDAMEEGGAKQGELWP